MFTFQDLMKPTPDNKRHSFTFEKLGHSYHFQIQDYRDLQEILELDEALWIATTAPTVTLKTDEVFLGLLDSDNDGRLRAEEIKDGIRFLLDHHAHYPAIKADNLELPLKYINTETELGQRIFNSARKVINRLDVKDEKIGVEQVRSVKKEVLGGGLDKAGIVLPEAAPDDTVEQFILDILETVGGKNHSTGKIGVDSDSLDEFFRQSRTYLEWRLEAGEIGSDLMTEILPLGTATEEACMLFKELSKKLIQYFLLCDIKRLNPTLIERAMKEPEANTALNLLQIEQAESYLADAPLGLLNADGLLDLTAEANPYFRGKLTDFREKVIKPLLGPEVSSIDKSSFYRLEKLFSPYLDWNDRKPDVSVNEVDDATIQNYLTEAVYQDTLVKLIEESHQTAFVLENLKELERLILYQALLLPLVNSFVSFPKLYNPNERALFEEGTLIMDGRHFTFAIRVEDLEHHIETSKHSNIFVIYCELYGKDGLKCHEIAVPVTSGNRGNLRLNKWGIFNDLDGNELHAKVIDIVENPISVKEAVVDPFVRIGRAFFQRLEEFSSKAEERLIHKELKAKDKKKADGNNGSLLAGGGVALAAVGSSFAFITKTFAGLTLKAVLFSLLIVFTIIAVPAGIAAYYRLTRRDLSSILEGSGWGINARMRLTRSQATCFTFRPKN